MRWKAGALMTAVVAVVVACTGTPSPTGSIPPASLAPPAPSPEPSSSLAPETPPATPAAGASAASVAFWTVERGIVVGTAADGSGEVWLTADGGQTWSTHEPGLPGLWFVTTEGTSDAWALTACDHSGLPTGCTIWASHDAGATWAPVGRGEFSGMSFTDSRHGWAASPVGPQAGGPTSSGVFRTGDGGRSWSVLAVSPCASIGWPIAVNFVSSTHGWVGCRGEEGAGQGEKGIVETTDGGRSWSTRAAVHFDGSQVGTIAGSDYLVGLSMRASGVGIAWEARGGTMRTLDAGRTWLAMPPGGTDAGPIPNGGWAATDDDWFVVMWDGNLQATALWASHDAGKEWRSVSAVPPTS